MLLYLATPPRPPFSDWFAQCARIIERRTGLRFVRLDSLSATARQCWQAYYDCGLSAGEAVSDFLEDE